MLALPPSEDLRPLLPALAAVALWMLWVGQSGGYQPETWYPSALLTLSLWAAVLLFGGRVLPRVRAARVALLAFAALVGLNYLSIVWAASPGSALDASNELALYLLMAWIFAVLPWTKRALAAVLGAWSIGVCAVCVVELIDASTAANLTRFFVGGRFATPMSYSNATGALAVMAMWPALILSARRELPAWLRAVCLGVATFLAGYSTLPQSRAALLGLAVTAVVAAVIASDRWRLLVRMAVVGVALAVCLPRAVAVDNAVNANANVTPVLRHAAAGILLTTLAAVAVALTLGVIEARIGARRRRPAWESQPTRRGRAAAALRSRGARYVVMGLAVIGIAAVAFVAEPHAVKFVHTVVRQGNTDASTGSDRLLSASPEERFDYDRVALKLFSGAPVVGIGAGNFGRHYDALRRFLKHSQYTHNLPLRVLAETGLVGELAFVVLIVALVIALIRVARGRDDLARASAAAALCIAGYFLVHGCLDWVDEFPALAAPAIALPLAAAGLRTRSTAPRPMARRLTGAAAAITGLALLLALTTSYVSLRLTDRAFSIFRASPARAYNDLSVARRLDPLSANPSVSEGTIALYMSDYVRSAASFQRSIGQEDAWYPRLELALIDAHLGHTAAALNELEKAARLDVDDPLIAEARARIATGDRIDPVAFNRLVLQEGASSSPGQETIR
ncbi:MAG: O-antigen ligase family protein [Solirubrobacteraceae bacterium]